MAQDRQPPQPEPIPLPGNSNPSQNALAMRGQFELGQAWDSNQQAPASDSDVLDLRDLWRLIVKHKWMLVSVAIVGLMAALLLSFVRTPLYLATTTLQVDKRAARVVQFSQEDPASQDLDDRTGIGTQLELLKSRVLAERVIDELRLDRQGLPTVEAIATESDAAVTDEAVVGEEADTGWLAMGQHMFDRIKESYNKISVPAATSTAQLNREEVVSAFQKTEWVWKNFGPKRAVRGARKEIYRPVLVQHEDRPY